MIGAIVAAATSFGLSKIFGGKSAEQEAKNLANDTQISIDHVTNYFDYIRNNPTAPINKIYIDNIGLDNMASIEQQYVELAKQNPRRADLPNYTSTISGQVYISKKDSPEAILITQTLDNLIKTGTVSVSTAPSTDITTIVSDVLAKLGITTIGNSSLTQTEIIPEGSEKTLIENLEKTLYNFADYYTTKDAAKMPVSVIKQETQSSVQSYLPFILIGAAILLFLIRR